MAASVSAGRYAMKRRKSWRTASAQGIGRRLRPRDRRNHMPRDGVPQQGGSAARLSPGRDRAAGGSSRGVAVRSAEASPV